MNTQRQETVKILAVDTESTLPIQFSLLLPYFVEKVIGYECFFDENMQRSSDKIAMEQLELSLSKDNFKTHAVHEIVQKNRTTDCYGDIQFEVDNRKRVSGFFHNPAPLPQLETVNVKLFLIVQ